MWGCMCLYLREAHDPRETFAAGNFEGRGGEEEDGKIRFLSLNSYQVGEMCHHSNISIAFITGYNTEGLGCTPEWNSRVCERGPRNMPINDHLCVQMCFMGEHCSGLPSVPTILWTHLVECLQVHLHILPQKEGSPYSCKCFSFCKLRLDLSLV
ncbi:PREDICTED: uncharacterized protein LOC109376517 isoform X2 [Hipposideros armiger]|uniref:Uncharacterized protein LOC109376517 isoform X2 n=1 Tax=Hipposideros armiger TaxID=186990 RepID=A0A8B7QIN8_HIPAR|nr:PREDICTED: uncharacterized protein LOC109376517 isoform X2 [Hipposideros armiger]